MLVTLSGRDRPGITRDLFTACSAQPVEVTDVDQIVMRDRLTIAASVDGARAHLEKLRPAIEELAHRLAMDYAISDRRRCGHLDPQSWRPRTSRSR